ncbi:phosphate/phosphite/phosphonate ABC transporter substrate-binding protein [Candidatus Riflebacteria bacterium]
MQKIKLPFFICILFSMLIIKPAVTSEVNKTPLRLGAVMYAKEASRILYTELAAYIGRKLGRRVVPKLFASYNEIILEVSNNKLDFAILTPIVFLNVREMLNVKCIAMPFLPSGNIIYRGLIMVNRENKNLQTLKDLEGKKMGYVDRYSTSGYILPKLLLKDAGVKTREVFLGNHVEVVKALKSKEIDVGAIYSEIFLEVPQLQKLKKDFKELAKTDFIPNDMIVADPSVPDEVVHRVRDILLDFHYHRKSEKKLRALPLSGFVPADQNLYAALQKIWLRALGRGQK